MKVKIGKSLKRRSEVNLGFDNSTTATFGHCQPLMCKEMVPDSQYEVEVDSLVRLSPLVRPTFGRVKYKVWHNFVPLADLYKPFESMLSQTPYTTAAGVEYIPTAVPQIELSELSRLFYTLDFFVTPYVNAGVRVNSDTSGNLYDNGYYSVGNIRAIGQSDSAFTINQSFISDTGRTWNNMYRTFSGATGSTVNYSDRWDIVFADETGNTPYIATPTNADMVWTEYQQTSSSDGNIFVFCQKLTERQKRLRKVLLGLGYSLDINNPSKVSMLPLVAYYKAWFTTLFPNRYKTWTQTNAFKLMEGLSDYGNNTITSGNTVQIAYFIGLLNDLCDTFYYDDADFYSAHLTGTSVNFTGTSIDYVDGLTSNVTPDGYQGKALVSNVQGLQPSADFSSTFEVSDTTLRMLRVLTKFVNKNTQIGGKIAEYLRVHYGADLINNLLENYFIGGDSIDIQISDVMSNAATDGAELGDYAGKGLGYKDGKSFKYDAKSFGYWITFSAVIPKSKWYQGIDPQLLHRERFEYFTPEMDALGFACNPKSLLITNEGIGVQGLNVSGRLNNKTFGFLPRYSEYKLPTKNIVNGDITLPSTRNDLMPYTLDKTFTPVEVLATPTTGTSWNNVRVWKFPAINAVADNLDLRRIGYKAEYGNFDRVFYANEDAEHQLMYTSRGSGAGLWDFFDGIDDNFVIHHIINIDAKIPMIPMSESFDTGGDEDNTMTVDKV